MSKYEHVCVTHWVGDGVSIKTAFRAASVDRAMPRRSAGEPHLGDQVCHLTYETDNDLDAQTVDDSPDTLVLHSQNADGSSRINKAAPTTAGQRTIIVDWLKAKGVTDEKLLWMKERFLEQFGHPWKGATRGEVAKILRYAVAKRFQWSLLELLEQIEGGGS